MTVLVQKDGSGSVEQTLYVKQVALPMGGSAQQPKLTPEQELQLARQQCAAMAKRMGEGVTVKSVEQLEPRGEWKGVKAVYAFADVNKLNLPVVPQAGPVKAAADAAIHFGFAKGAPSKLTVAMPPMQAPAQGGPGQADMAGGEEMINAMLPMLLEGSRIVLKIQVEGRITETDATYVNARRDAVGLIRVNLDGVAKDPVAMEAVKSFQKIKDPLLLQKRLLEADIGKYFNFETKPKIQIEFQ